MASKTILLQLDGADLSVGIGATIHRDEIYGKQSKTVEKDGQALQKIILDPEGQIFLQSDFTHLRSDSEGSLAEPPIVQTQDGEVLEPKPSSFKEKRVLECALLSQLAKLRVESIIPAECEGLPPGVYKTEFAYRDAPLLKDAFLNVTPDGAFLLVGNSMETPLQGKADVYSFFDSDETEDDIDGEDEDLSFEMF